MLGTVKNARAKLDKARADYDQAVGKTTNPEELNKLEANFKRVVAELEGISDSDKAASGVNLQLQELKTARESLVNTLKNFTGAEDAAKKCSTITSAP